MKCKCKCVYEWESRVKKPKSCPRCKAYLKWKKEVQIDFTPVVQK